MLTLETIRKTADIAIKDSIYHEHVQFLLNMINQPKNGPTAESAKEGMTQAARGLINLAKNTISREATNAMIYWDIHREKVKT